MNVKVFLLLGLVLAITMATAMAVEVVITTPPGPLATTDIPTTTSGQKKTVVFTTPTGPLATTDIPTTTSGQKKTVDDPFVCMADVSGGLKNCTCTCNCNSSCPATPPPETSVIVATATCDSAMLFYADGVHQAFRSIKQDPIVMGLPGDTQVYAIECQNFDVNSAASILASFDDGTVTDSSWRCSNSLQSGWNSVSFDDSSWSAAYEMAPNGISPWTSLSSIDKDAKWIRSSPIVLGNAITYCRYTVA